MTFFLSTGRYSIATPDSFQGSERTIEMPFYDLADNRRLQELLGLESSVFFMHGTNGPLKGNNLRQAAAWSLSEYSSEGRQQKREYLSQNGSISLLVLDPELLGKVRETLD